MKLYNVLVRLGGAITNEVIKEKVTAAEIAVLQRIHGGDAVQDIVHVGAVNGRSDARERSRLAVEYPKGPSADGKARLDAEAFIASVFGVSGVPLPQEYVAPETEAAKDEVFEMAPDADEEFVPVKVDKVVRVPTKAQKAVEAADSLAA